MAGDEETPSSSSPIVQLLKSIKQVVLSKASPIADAILFFFLVFLLSVAGHTFQDVYGTNQLVQSFKRRLLSVVDKSSRWPATNVLQHVNFKRIHSHEDVWDFIQHNLGDILYADKFYDGGAVPADQNGLVMGHSVVAQKVRLRQKRVKPVDCSGFPPRLNSETPPGLVNVKCYPRYSAAAEDRDQFLGTEWTSAEMLMLRPRNPLQHKFQDGAYAIELPAGQNAYKQRLQELKEQKWTDRGTRAVFVDACMLNIARNQFVSLRFEFDFSEYGKVVPKATIRAFRDRLDHDAFTDIVNYISEAALYAIVSVNAFREVGRLRIVGPSVFFSNIWNIIMSGTLVCCFLSMNYRIAIVRSQWSTMQGKAKTELKWSLDANRQYDVKWDWDELGENDTLIVKLQAIAMVLAYLRSFAFLQFFSSKIDDFITSLSHSKSNLIAYTSIMAIFIAAFSVTIHSAYGVEQFQFSSLPLAGLSLTELLFGNFDSQPIDAQTGVVSSLLLIGFFAILGMVSMSAILALVNWATREVLRGNVQRETDDRDMNLKHQLSAGVKRLIMSEYMGSLGRALRPLVEEKAKVITNDDDEDFEEHFGADERITMVNAAKFTLKGLLVSVTELRSSVRGLCESMSVEYDDDVQVWRRENWWRKFRNEAQEKEFGTLLDALKSGEPDDVTEVIRNWKRVEGIGAGHTHDINWRDKDGFSALHYASLGGDGDLVLRLLDLKADANARNDDGNTCVHLATLAGKLNAVRVLAEHGHAHLDDVLNNALFTPIHMAAYAGHTALCKYLAEEQEVDVLCQTGEGLTPLHLAVIQNNDETVEYLANRFPQAIDMRANGGETPLHIAVLTNKDVHLLRVLLKAGAKVAERMYDGENVYQVSVLAKREPAVQRLLHRTLSMGDNYQLAHAGLDERASGLGFIKFAMMGMHTEMAELLSDGADIDTVQPGSGTALHVAVRRRASATVEFLVDAGANVHIKDADGLTPLQIAVDEGFFDTYELMANSLKFEQLPIDSKGNTLLHRAAMAGNNMQIVQHLVQHHKIDPMSVNAEGQTCYDVADFILRVNAEIGDATKCGLHDKILHYFREGKDDYEDSVRRPLMPGETEQSRAKATEDISRRVVRFFENIGLQKDARAYARLLAENEVDFDGLTLLQDAHLLELGITKLGIRNKILFGIAGLKAKRRALGEVLHSTLPANEVAGAPKDADVLALGVESSFHDY